MPRRIEKDHHRHRLHVLRIEPLEKDSFSRAVRLPIEERGEDVLVPGQRPEPHPLVPVERRVRAEPPIDRVGSLVEFVSEGVQLHRLVEKTAGREALSTGRDHPNKISLNNPLLVQVRAQASDEVARKLEKLRPLAIVGLHERRGEPGEPLAWDGKRVRRCHRGPAPLGCLAGLVTAIVPVGSDLGYP